MSAGQTAYAESPPPAAATAGPGIVQMSELVSGVPTTANAPTATKKAYTYFPTGVTIPTGIPDSGIVPDADIVTALRNFPTFLNMFDGQVIMPATTAARWVLQGDDVDWAGAYWAWQAEEGATAPITPGPDGAWVPKPELMQLGWNYVPASANVPYRPIEYLAWGTDAACSPNAPNNPFSDLVWGRVRGVSAIP